jgi:hypothetical protein
MIDKRGHLEFFQVRNALLLIICGREMYFRFQAVNRFSFVYLKKYYLINQMCY